MRYLVLLLCLSPVAAQPPQTDSIQAGSILLEGEPLDDQRARLRACWQSISGDSARQYWRASLEERKWQMQWEHHQNLGEIEGEAELEREWQDQLERTRAQLALRIPQEEFEISVNSEWTADPANANWTTQVKGRFWNNWRAQAAWQQAASRTQLRFSLTDGSDQLEAERLVSPEDISYRGKLTHALGPGSLELQATRRWGEGWQNQWGAGYRCQFGDWAQLSTRGNRRWSLKTGDWQDTLEAEIQLFW